MSFGHAREFIAATVHERHESRTGGKNLGAIREWRDAARERLRGCSDQLRARAALVLGLARLADDPAAECQRLIGLLDSVGGGQVPAASAGGGNDCALSAGKRPRH